jgi:hypothetical protein
LPLEIWLEIFEFATYVHQAATIRPLDPFTPKRITDASSANTQAALRLAMRTKLALVLVSRSWRQATMHLLYEHLLIRNPARATAISQVLEETSGYGRWTRHIEIHTFSRGAGDIRYLQTLFRIFHHCPNIKILSGTWIYRLPIQFLDGLSKIYGPSLSALYWKERNDGPPESYNPLSTPEFLGSFRSLRVLDIRHFVGADPWSRPGCIRAPILPLLEDLIISTHPRSLSTATILQLPSLRNLILRTPTYDERSEALLISFLKVHGPSLVSVDLPSPSPDSEPEMDSTISRRVHSHINPDIFLNPDHCPILESISFPVTSPPLAPQNHSAIRRIGLHGVRSDGLYPDKQSMTRDHLMAMTSDKYPELELIQTVGYFVDADKSDELIKDIFIWWVEKFEEVGIDFLDGEGVLWAYTEPIDKESIEVRAKDPGLLCNALSEILWEKGLIKDEQRQAKDQR